MPRRVLVTGGAGYLGSVLVPELLERGDEVIVVDRCLFGDHSLDAVASHPRFQLHALDLNSTRELSRLLKGVDSVVHLASISNDPTCELDPNLAIQWNFVATVGLTRLAVERGVKRMVFASSCSVYGAAGSRWLDEESPTAPVTLYALTKLSGEREVLAPPRRGFTVTCLRFATLFGLSPRMRFDLAVNAMIRRGLEQRPIIVNGTGQQFRPFVHVRDAAGAIQQVLDASPARVAGRVFNVGANRLNFRIEALANGFMKWFPALPLERKPAQEDVRSYRVRFDRIRKALRYEPRFGISDAVAELRAAAGRGELGDLNQERYYNLSVMTRLFGRASGTPVPRPTTAPPLERVTEPA